MFIQYNTLKPVLHTHKWLTWLNFFSYFDNLIKTLISGIQVIDFKLMIQN